MVRRQAFDKHGRKIDYAFYEDDYVVEYPDEDEVPEIAFWHYDTYPYTLWGAVVDKMIDGSVKTKEYSGYRFKPKFICPEPEAKALIKELETLKKEYEKTLGLTHKEYRLKLADFSVRSNIPMPNQVFK